MLFSLKTNIDNNVCGGGRKGGSPTSTTGRMSVCFADTGITARTGLGAPTRVPPKRGPRIWFGGLNLTSTRLWARCVDRCPVRIHDAL